MIIPQQHFVGFQSNGKGSSLLGFATPYGTDSAALKRQNTVRSWGSKNFPCKVLDNELLPGFRLVKEVRRNSGWGKGNVVWRIEDPRGFELEITSPNLASIIDCTTIVDGEIQGRCIWGRDGATNVLLPESSEPYTTAMNSTKLTQQKVALKDVHPGDLVRLQNGNVILYLGSYHVLHHELDINSVSGRFSPHSRTSYTYDVKMGLGLQKKRHLCVNEQIYAEIAEGKATLVDKLTPRRPAWANQAEWADYRECDVMAASDLKVSEICRKGALPVSINDVCQFINGLPQVDRKFLFGLHAVSALSPGPFGKITIKEQPNDSQDLSFPLTAFTTDNGVWRVVSAGNRKRDYGVDPHVDWTIDIKRAVDACGKAVELGRTTSTNIEDTRHQFINLVLATAAGDFVVDTL